MTAIARTWAGHVPRRHADAFEDHLHATGIAEAAQISGYLGAQILRRQLGDDVEFTLVTYWSTWESIRVFAGQNTERAVLYPGDERFALVPDADVTHRLVTYCTYNGLDR